MFLFLHYNRSAADFLPTWSVYQVPRFLDACASRLVSPALISSDLELGLRLVSIQGCGDPLAWDGYYMYSGMDISLDASGASERKKPVGCLPLAFLLLTRFFRPCGYPWKPLARLHNFVSRRHRYSPRYPGTCDAID